MRRGHILCLITLVAAPGSAQAAPADGEASIPSLSGVWAHTSITGFEPLVTGPTSLTNLSRRGITSDNRQLVGDYRNPILKPEAAEIVKKHGEISLDIPRLATSVGREGSRSSLRPPEYRSSSNPARSRFSITKITRCAMCA